MLEEDLFLVPSPPSPAAQPDAPTPKKSARTVSIDGRGYNPLSGEALLGDFLVSLQQGPQAVAEARDGSLYFTAGLLRRGPVSCQSLTVEAGSVANAINAASAPIGFVVRLKISGATGSVTLYESTFYDPQTRGENLRRELSRICAAAL